MIFLYLRPTLSATETCLRWRSFAPGSLQGWDSTCGGGYWLIVFFSKLGTLNFLMTEFKRKKLFGAVFLKQCDDLKSSQGWIWNMLMSLGICWNVCPIFPTDLIQKIPQKMPFVNSQVEHLSCLPACCEGSRSQSQNLDDGRRHRDRWGVFFGKFFVIDLFQCVQNATHLFHKASNVCIGIL